MLGLSDTCLTQKHLTYFRSSRCQTFIRKNSGSIKGTRSRPHVNADKELGNQMPCCTLAKETDREHDFRLRYPFKLICHSTAFALKDCYIAKNHRKRLELRNANGQYSFQFFNALRKLRLAILFSETYFRKVLKIQWQTCNIVITLNLSSAAFPHH